MAVMKAGMIPSTTSILNPNINFNKHKAYTSRCRPQPRLQPRLTALPAHRSLAPIAVTSAHAAPPAPTAAGLASQRLRRLADEFRSLLAPLDRVKRLLAYAEALPPFPDAGRRAANRVTGCTAQVWLSVAVDAKSGRMRFAADSDSEIVKGFCSCLVAVLDGALPEEVLEMRAEDFAELDVARSPARTAHSRVNTWQNVLTSMQKRTAGLIDMREGQPRVKC